MRTRSALLVFALATAAAIACWTWSSRAIAAPEQGAPAAGEPAPPPTAAANAPLAPTPSTTEAVGARTEAPAVAPPPGPEFALRGRCVDEEGKPLAGVTARVRSWDGSKKRMAAWLQEHGPPPSVDASATTGDDGTFALHFWPPPPLAFGLQITCTGRASMAVRVDQLAPGGSKDLGDIVMVRGTLLRGRVVDTDGVPVTKVTIEVGSPVDRPGELVRSGAEGLQVRSSDGSFQGRVPFPAGSHAIQAHYRELVSPKTVVLDGRAAEQTIEIVLAKLDDARAIAGVVVDEQGKPLSDVQIMPTATGRGFVRAHTDRDGEFRIQQWAQGDTAPLALQFDRTDFEITAPPEPFAWGRTDLRVVLRRSAGFDLLVVTANGERPVEDYRVHVVPHRFGVAHNSIDSRVRSEGHHAGGRARIEGVRSGTNLIAVEPEDSALARTLTPIEIPDGPAPQVTIRVAANAARELHLHRTDGTRVAGAPVQITDRSMLAPEAQRFVARIAPRPFEQWLGNTRSLVLIVSEVKTDANGIALLRGPGDHGLHVRLPGPPNTPMDFDDVRLDVAAPLDVAIDTGALLYGEVVPLAALAELPLLGAADSDSAPSLELARGAGPQLETYPGGGRKARIGADGLFDLRGVPPGTWTVRLLWPRPFGGGWMHAGQDVGTVQLQDGVATQFTVDASFLLPGDLDGTVLHNGRALASARLSANGTFGNDNGNDSGQSFPIATDDSGRFHLHARAGDYRIAMSTSAATFASLTAPEHAVVTTGRTVTQTFRFETGSVRVHLLAADGSPAVGVTVELLASDGQHRHSLPPTDAGGVTTEEVTLEPVTAQVLPKRLQDPRARMAAMTASPPANGDPLAPLYRALGPVQPTMGTMQEFTFRLPADWDR